MGISVTVKKMIGVMLGVALIMIIGGVLFFRSTAAAPFAVGVLLTTGLNIVKVIWLERSVRAIANMDDPKTVKRAYYVQYFMRYGLTIVVLLLAALTPPQFIDLIGALFGIFTLKIAVHALRFLIKEDGLL